MKSFEVKLSVIGGSKDQTRTVFVEATTKSEIENCEGVLKIWKRDDITPDECPMEILDGVIVEKTPAN
jgi:hypothetical protein